MYPACKNSHPLPEDMEKLAHVTGLKCELCSGDLVVREASANFPIADSSSQNYIVCQRIIPATLLELIGGRMQTRELAHPSQAPSTPDLVFRTPVNWTYVVFFACLGLAVTPNAGKAG